MEDKNSAQYICVCPEGFTGDKCSTKISPSPQPRSQEGSGGMPKAAIAGIVAGVLLAALVCAVLVVVGLCVRHRRSRRSQGELKAHSFFYNYQGFIYGGGGGGGGVGGKLPPLTHKFPPQEFHVYQ